MAIDVELLLGTKSKVGEGPIWDYENSTLYWIDIFGKEVHSYDPATGGHEVRTLDAMIGTVVCGRSVSSLALTLAAC